MVITWLSNNNLMCQISEVNSIASNVFPAIAPVPELWPMVGKEMNNLIHPVGRVGNESDMAGLSLFLSSRASAFVTGSVICCDGGTSWVASLMGVLGSSLCS